MNGPEHYREAERILQRSEQELERATPNTFAEVQSAVVATTAMAQVHATLALAAATKVAGLLGGGAGRLPPLPEGRMP